MDHGVVYALLHPSYLIRQIAAFSCAGTLAWDCYRDSSMIESFSIWVLAVHFLYFQLPIRSKLLTFVHSASLLGSAVISVQYAYLLFWNPLLEQRNSEQWEIPISTAVIRSFLLHFAPLLFHGLDIAANQAQLITAYRTDRPGILMLWSISSLPLLGFVFEFTFPENIESMEADGIARNDFLKFDKIISLGAMLFMVVLLYFLVLRRAFRSSNISRPGSPQTPHHHHRKHF